MTPHCLEQGRFPAVAEPHPKRSDSRVGLAREKKEILVLAYDEQVLCGSMAADLCIGRFRQAQVKNMLTLDAAFQQKPRKRRRKLVTTRNFKSFGARRDRFGERRSRWRRGCLRVPGTRSRRGSPQMTPLSRAVPEYP